MARELAGTAFASITYVEETESTNADAAALLDDERVGGHTIVAEYQRRGAGRKGRAWLAPAGTALLFTTILPRSVDNRNLWIVPFWVALAVRNALLDFGVTTTLQWPNDLLLGDAKVAGMLCQSSSKRGRDARVACGVGINVRRPAPSPESIRLPHSATTLRRSSGRACSRNPSRIRTHARRLDRPAARQRASGMTRPQLPGQRYRIQLDGDAHHSMRSRKGSRPEAAYA